MQHLKPLFWKFSEPILPSVYGESLSYLEDIGKLAHKVSEIVDQVNQLIDYYDGIKDLLADMENTLSAIKAQADALEKMVNAKLADIQNQFDALDTELTDKLADALRQMQEQVDAIKPELIELINNRFVQYQEALDNMQASMVENNEQIKAEIDSKNAALIQSLNLKLNQFINSLPDVQDVVVVNPWSGLPASLQSVLDYIYDTYYNYGLSAQEYDDLDLTAQQFDTWSVNNLPVGLTAYQYDNYAKRFLIGVSTAFMFSAMTGRSVTTQDAIDENTSLLRTPGAVTCGEFDALALTVGEYDQLMLTVHNYDWFANRMLQAPNANPA